MFGVNRVNIDHLGVLPGCFTTQGHFPGVRPYLLKPEIGNKRGIEHVHEF